jgi:hypothetical protein
VSVHRYSGRTATHYEVLGVAPGASHDEIKRAYLDRALKYHPDRQAEQTAEARERAEFHMRELNGAWEVLRSPARRADYDARLRGDTPVWEQAGTRAKRTAPVTPRVADLEPERPGAAAPSSSGWRVGPIVAIVMVVVAVLGFAAWATTSSSDGPRDVRVETGTSFEEGGCVVLGSVGGRITPVPGECSAIGASRIDQIVDLGRPCSGNAEAFDVQNEKLRLCLRSGGS